MLCIVIFLISLDKCAFTYDVTLYGPGLHPNAIVMPARYFFVKFNVSGEELKTSHLAETLKVEISGKTDIGHCHVWTNILDRKDGSFIVRYKNYQTCYDFTINIIVNGKHVENSPFLFLGPIYSDECYCPEQHMDTWLNHYGCTGDYQRVYDDLKLFPKVQMKAAVKKIIEKYYSPESTSFCHYVVKNNEVYRKCYGKHVGFNMFADNILLFLARKVTLADIELVINLGDWPLVRKGGEVLPIFSWCGSDNTIDIVMPTYDITESTLENMGRVSLDILSVQGKTNLVWSERDPKAFWRGRDSCPQRLKLIDIARSHPDLFNASLTNFFFYRDKESKYGPKQPNVSFFKFFDYKYQINIDGTVAAYRFPYLLAGGGLVFKQQSKFYEHFYPELREWEHYVPVKHDLSDLVDQLQWARHHDNEAEVIAKNAQNFANNHLLPQHIICYHAVLFLEWSKRQQDHVELESDMTHVPQPQHKCHCEHQHQSTKDEL